MMFLFGFFSAMSGQQFFADAPYQLYNVMYTALPILCVAILDKMLPAQFLQDNPRLYQLQKHTAFDPLISAAWPQWRSRFARDRLGVSIPIACSVASW